MAQTHPPPPPLPPHPPAKYQEKTVFYKSFLNESDF